MRSRPRTVPILPSMIYMTRDPRHDHAIRGDRLAGNHGRRATEVPQLLVGLQQQLRRDLDTKGFRSRTVDDWLHLRRLLDG
jgi:hypothetical protein